MVSMLTPVAPGRWPDHIDEEWTVRDLETLPTDGLRYEIIDGILQVSPTPVPIHQQVVVRLVLAFSAVCPPDHKVYVAALAWQPDDRTSLEPDLLVVPRSAVGPKSITGTPAVVVEVLSPSTARIDRMLKFSRYADGGIGQYWIVDPTGPSIQVYTLTDDGYIPLAESAGDEPVSVDAPLNITVVSSALVAD